MLYCSACKDQIRNKYYKYLWINDRKTDITVCQECYILRYLLKPWLFKKDHPKIYEKAGLKTLVR